MCKNFINLYFLLIILFSFSIFAEDDYLKKYAIKSYADKLFANAKIQSPNLLSKIAFDVFINAENYYKAGNYKKSKELLDKLWKDHPAGTNEWRNAKLDEGILNIGTPNCYYALRMLTDTVNWKVKNNTVKNPKILQFTILIVDKTQGKQAQNKKEKDSNDGPIKINKIYPKIVESNYKIVRSSMWLFNEYINAITEGKVKVATKFVYLPKVTIPVKCDTFCNPSDNYQDILLESISEEIKNETDFWWLIFPSHIGQFQDTYIKHLVNGGMGGFNKGPLFLIDDLSLIRKRTFPGTTSYRDEEHRAYFPQWMQHEFFHYLYRIYPEFELEKESHQWFDKKKWPSDFVGIFEPDYYHESLFKRIIPQKTLVNNFLIADKGKPFYKYITIDSVRGEYETRPVQNKWNIGKIQIRDKNKLEWKNEAGTKWQLLPNFNQGYLDTTKENPYFDSKNVDKKSFRLKLKKDSNGDYIIKKDSKGKQSIEVDSFLFNGQFYYKKN